MQHINNIIDSPHNLAQKNTQADVTHACADAINRTHNPYLPFSAHDTVYHLHFQARTIDDIQSISKQISKLLPNSPNSYLGISELGINAIEHGNLGISYDDKTQLLRDFQWQSEIDRRLALPENLHKQVHINVYIGTEQAVIQLEDEGKGFNWEHYLTFCEERLRDNHGRGIAVANSICFDNIEFVSPGNIVYCYLALR